MLTAGVILELKSRGFLLQPRFFGTVAVHQSRSFSKTSPLSTTRRLRVSAASTPNSDDGRTATDAVNTRQQEAARNVMAGRNAVSTEMGGKGNFSTLQERINSGEFGSRQGSKKERITRPLRRALAKDSVGPGASTCLFRAWSS